MASANNFHQEKSQLYLSSLSSRRNPDNSRKRQMNDPGSDYDNGSSSTTPKRGRPRLEDDVSDSKVKDKREYERNYREKVSLLFIFMKIYSMKYNFKVFILAFRSATVVIKLKCFILILCNYYLNRLYTTCFRNRSKIKPSWSRIRPLMNFT